MTVACGNSETATNAQALNPDTRAKIDVLSYALDARFVWNDQPDVGRLVATVRIDIAAAPGDATLPADLVLDSAVHVTRVSRVPSGRALPFTQDAEQKLLHIDLGAYRTAREQIEVAYEATPTAALRAVPVRAGDPIAARVVSTYSEPLGVKDWMPCNADVSDRATYSVAMTLPHDEALAANGVQTEDVASGTEHRTKFVFDQAVPAYLMSFAAGNIVLESGRHGALPLSIWHRRGLAQDYAALLGEIDAAMTTMETRLGVPFPYASYGMVMLPDYPGGVEHASLTFQAEGSSASPALNGTRLLIAHELAHQWFGDSLSVKTWNDVWVKEGLATLFEPTVLFADEHVRSLHGDYFYVGTSPMIDAAAKPDDKYTGGVYGRSAWWFSQVRSLIGDDAFFGALGDLNRKFRSQSIEGADVIAAFAPHLDLAIVKQATDALVATTPPVLEPSGDGATFAVTLHDPAKTVFAPLEMYWQYGDGHRETLAVQTDVPVVLGAPRSGAFLVVDPHRVHPDLFSFDATEEQFVQWDGITIPGAPDSMRNLLALGGAYDAARWVQGSSLAIAPTDLPMVMSTLDGRRARAELLGAACLTAARDPRWVDSLKAALLAAPAELLGFSVSFAACSKAIDAEHSFAADWAALATVAPARLSFLSRLVLPPERAVALWQPLAEHGSTLFVRAVALGALSRQVPAVTVAGSTEARAQFRNAFAAVVRASAANETVAPAIRGIVTAKSPNADENAEALSALTTALASPFTRSNHRDAVCAAAKLTESSLPAWTAFAAGVDRTKVSAEAAAALDTPAQCNPPR